MSYRFGHVCCLWRNTKLLIHSLIWSQCKIKVSVLRLLGYMVQVCLKALICTLKASFLLKKRRKCMCYSDYFSWIGSLFWSFIHEVLHDGLCQLLLLNEAVLLLAACYYNSSFAGSVCAWLVNQLCSENWQNPFSFWVSFLLGYWAEWAPQKATMSPRVLQKELKECIVGDDAPSGVANFSSSLPTLGLVAHPVFVEPCFCVSVTMCVSAQTQLII